MFYRVNLIIIFGFLLRVGISFWNAFYGPSLGADSDALGFHAEAVDFSRDLVLNEFVIGHIYAYFLGCVYAITTDSLFVGGLLSDFVWLFSAVILIKIIKLFELDAKYQASMMLIYTLLPSSVFLTSVTLREPYQMLFVNMAIYSSLKIVMFKNWTYWIWLIISAVGMATLHGALLAFGLFVVIGTVMLFVLSGQKKFSIARLVVAILILPLILYNGISIFDAISYKLDDGLSVAVETYQQSLIGIDARANYRDMLNINESGLLFFIPVSVIQYALEPMPWHIATAGDLELFLENILRVWLLYRAVRGIKNLPKINRRSLMFVIVSYVLIESIWAIGTANWGTAVRHHLPSLGILLVAAYAYSSRKLSYSQYDNLYGAVSNNGKEGVR